jgi:hypothetical protein
LRRRRRGEEARAGLSRLAARVRSGRGGNTENQKDIHFCRIIGYHQEIALELGFWGRKSACVKKRETTRRLRP